MLRTRAVEVQVDSGAHGLGGVGEGGRPGADDALAGDFEGAERAGSQVRFARVHLVRVDDPGRRGSRCVRPSPRGRAARRAVRRPRRRAGRRAVRPGCRSRRRTRRGAGGPRVRGGPPGSRGWRRNRCAGSRCWPWRCRRRRRRTPRRGRCAGGERASSRAMAVPTTPAPTTVTSYDLAGQVTRRS